MFRKLFGKKRPRFDAPIAPDGTFFAIGDIHGCASKLNKLLAQIEELDSIAPIVLVGDYIDRGEQSADVLRVVQELDKFDHVNCLIGNHEEMLLDFLVAPTKKGPRWLRYGGLQTLASFGVGGVNAETKGEALELAAKQLLEAMGHDLIDWIKNLPTHWTSGNIAVVHAGADPSLPIGLQPPKTLRWGHPDFDEMVRNDGIWIVHGHTIVDQASATDGRIAIDTGAYATGLLTAAKVSEGNVSFIQV